MVGRLLVLSAALVLASCGPGGVARPNASSDSSRCSVAVSGVVDPNSRVGGIVDLTTGHFTESSDERTWGSLDPARNQWVPVAPPLIAPDGNSDASIVDLGGTSSAVARTDLRSGATHVLVPGIVPRSAVVNEVAIADGVAWTLLPQTGGGLRVSRYHRGGLHGVGAIPSEIATSAGTMWLAGIDSGCGASPTRIAAPPSPATVTGACPAAPLSWSAPDGRGCAG